jgi:hypothetical protein
MFRILFQTVWWVYLASHLAAGHGAAASTVLEWMALTFQLPIFHGAVLGWMPGLRQWLCMFAHTFLGVRPKILQSSFLPVLLNVWNVLGFADFRTRRCSNSMPRLDIIVDIVSPSVIS